MNPIEFKHHVKISYLIERLKIDKYNFFQWMLKNYDSLFKGIFYVYYSDGDYHPLYKSYPKLESYIHKDASIDEREMQKERRFLIPVSDIDVLETYETDDFRLFMKIIKEKNKNIERDSFFYDDLHNPICPLTLEQLYIPLQSAILIRDILKIELNIESQTLVKDGEETQLTPTQTIYLWALGELSNEHNNEELFTTNEIIQKAKELQQNASLMLVPSLTNNNDSNPEGPGKILKKLIDEYKWITSQKGNSKKSHKFKLNFKILTFVIPEQSPEDSRIKPD